jgi:1-aminocyclopropane-1-carboxylate deaminase/D-cysteine desulfhydrase-like pyridoxal-dependent ACC family enzyme
VPAAADHAQLVPPTIETIEPAAQVEGLILDPVYTDKTMAGFMHQARAAGTAPVRECES